MVQSQKLLKDIAEHYFNSGHFNFILTCEPIVRTSYKAQIAQKAVSCTKGITYRYMRFGLQIFPGFNHCQLKSGINCARSSFLYLQCSSCQYFGQRKQYSKKKNLKRQIRIKYHIKRVWHLPHVA